jgi:2Fe-2S ferredoxin
MRIRCVAASGELFELEGREGVSLMSVLRRHATGVEAVCGGACSCGTCHVYVDEAWRDRLPPRDDGEEALLDSLDSRRPGASRLSCQIALTPDLDGLSVTVAPDN